MNNRYVQQSERATFLTDVLVYGAAQSLLRLRGLIILPVLSRNLGAEGYGLFTQVSVTIAMLIPLVLFRLDTALVRFLSGEEDPDVFRQKFYSALIFTLLIAGLTLTLFITTAGIGAKIIFGDIQYAALMLPVGIYLLTSSFSTFGANYFRISKRLKVLSIIELAKSAIEIGVILILVKLSYGVQGVIWGLAIINSIFGSGFLVVIGRSIGWFKINFQELLGLLRYSIPLLPNSLLRWSVNYVDRLVITQFLGVSTAGIYAASYSLSQSLGLLVAPLGFVLFPHLSQLWNRNDKAEVEKYLGFATHYYLLLAIPACIGLTLISQPLLAKLAADEFLTGTALVFWLTLGFVFSGIFQINMYVFHLILKTQYLTAIFALAAVINLGINVLLIPVIELHGAAIATFISYLLMATISTIYCKRKINYAIRWLDLGKAILAACIMGAVLFVLPLNSFGHISVAVLLSVIVYILLLFFLQGFTNSELRRVKQLVQSLYVKDA